MKKLLAAAVLAAAPFVASAQADWPTKPVRIVVPFAAGGTTDITARIVAEQLTKALGQTFLVENKGGAGGNLGAADVAKSAPDGYTFLMGTPGTQAINQFLYAKMPYDTQKDFVPVSLVVKVPNVLVVNPGLGVKSVQELLALAKAKPGTINYGTPGSGTTGHLSTELLKSLTRTDFTHVPYKGSGPMLQDLLGGQVQMAIDNLPSSMPFIKAGKLVALAVTSPEPSPELPGVPTLGSVVPGYVAESWFVLMAPAGTPDAIVSKLSAEVDRIVRRPEVVERFKALGAEPVGGTPKSLGDFIALETAKWRDVVKASGARVD
ncbi:MAG TPA: tripartite tricarboxylate transporter substrate binding protein [Casimicrobiaceae bacterium]